MIATDDNIFDIDGKVSQRDLFCIAVPIRDIGGAGVAALSVSYRKAAVTEAELAAALPALRDTADVIGRKLFARASRISSNGRDSRAGRP